MRYEESLAQLKEILSKEFTFRNATDDELARLNELKKLAEKYGKDY